LTKEPNFISGRGESLDGLDPALQSVHDATI